MYEEFDGRTRTKIVRDADGIARVLSHADRHVATTAATQQLAANDYLSRYGHLLGLKRQHLKNLTGSVVQDPTGATRRLSLLAVRQKNCRAVAMTLTHPGREWINATVSNPPSAVNSVTATRSGSVNIATNRSHFVTLCNNGPCAGFSRIRRSSRVNN
jgi:hypothetical protein